MSETRARDTRHRVADEHRGLAHVTFDLKEVFVEVSIGAAVQLIPQPGLPTEEVLLLAPERLKPPVYLVWRDSDRGGPLPRLPAAHLTSPFSCRRARRSAGPPLHRGHDWRS